MEIKLDVTKHELLAIIFYLRDKLIKLEKEGLTSSSTYLRLANLRKKLLTYITNN